MATFSELVCKPLQVVLYPHPRLKRGSRVLTGHATILKISYHSTTPKMTKFLTTSSIASGIEEVVTGATHDIYLISPYLQVPPILFERLQGAGRRGITITIVYGKNELRKELYEQLIQLKNLRLYFLANLHAKCYLNESMVVVTSMNLYDFSEKNNREMGVLLTCQEPAYAAARQEVDSILEAAELKWPLPRPSLVGALGSMVANSFAAAVGAGPVKATAGSQPAEPRPRRAPAATATKAGGLCIRCLTAIPRNPSRPLCRTCYEVWAEFENPDYRERGCHHCGKPGDVSMARPLCYGCYRQAQAS